MKKTAIISDIHANYEALKTVLLYCENNNIDKIVNLGDVVGYGPDPQLCLDALNAVTVPVIKIMGNHEHMLLAHTNKRLIDQEKYIADISRFEDGYVCSDSNMFFSHTGIVGSENVGLWGYLNSPDKILECIKTSDYFVSFYGHTHRHRISYYCPQSEIFRDELLPEKHSYSLNKNLRYYVNVGSVGQARANKTEASFAVLIEEEKTFLLEFHHLNYNSFRTYKKMLEKNFDKSQALYLLREKWRRALYGGVINGRLRIHWKGFDR